MPKTYQRTTFPYFDKYCPESLMLHPQRVDLPLKNEGGKGCMIPKLYMHSVFDSKAHLLFLNKKYNYHMDE